MQLGRRFLPMVAPIIKSLVRRSGHFSALDATSKHKIIYGAWARPQRAPHLTDGGVSKVAVRRFLTVVCRIFRCKNNQDDVSQVLISRSMVGEGGTETGAQRDSQGGGCLYRYGFTWVNFYTLIFVLS